MGRQSVAFPTGVEFFRNSVRIRFTWNGRRCCETLQVPQTPAGIQAASNLRAQVVGLIKSGQMTQSKYDQLFQKHTREPEQEMPLFGDYAQLWLDSREIVEGTRKNYLWALNTYWMPHFAMLQVNQITSVRIRKLVNATVWKSPNAKRNALARLSSVMKTAMLDGLIERNPVDSIEMPRRERKEIDPFTREEADSIIAWLYGNLKWQSMIYAPYFEFAFYTGMRPSEIAALRWDELDLEQRTANVCRIVADGTIHERTKTNKPRLVLLNERALHAIEQARAIANQRATRLIAHPRSPYVFPPAKIAPYIMQSSTTDRYFKTALTKLGLRDRPQYNARHTYATLCLMAGMNPAFIATQLGHSVQMLLSRYARWINSSTDWHELDKLGLQGQGPIGIRLVSNSPA